MSHDEHNNGPASRWSGIVGVCFVAYFLSPPIVLWVLSRFYTHFSQIPQWLSDGLVYFYLPIIWLCQNVNVIGKFYGACIYAMVDPMFTMIH